MNLPMIDTVESQKKLYQSSALEIAQLHCLRSIAVNLEAIAAFIGLWDEVDAEAYENRMDDVREISVKPK